MLVLSLRNLQEEDLLLQQKTKSKYIINLLCMNELSDEIEDYIV